MMNTIYHNTRFNTIDVDDLIKAIGMAAGLNTENDEFSRLMNEINQKGETITLDFAVGLSDFYSGASKKARLTYDQITKVEVVAFDRINLLVLIGRTSGARPRLRQLGQIGVDVGHHDPDLDDGVRVVQDLVAIVVYHNLSSVLRRQDVLEVHRLDIGVPLGIDRVLIPSALHLVTGRAATVHGVELGVDVDLQIAEVGEYRIGHHQDALDDHDRLGLQMEHIIGPGVRGEVVDRNRDVLAGSGSPHTLDQQLELDGVWMVEVGVGRRGLVEGVLRNGHDIVLKIRTEYLNQPRLPATGPTGDADGVGVEGVRENIVNVATFLRAAHLAQSSKSMSRKQDKLIFTLFNKRVIEFTYQIFSHFISILFRILWYRMSGIKILLLVVILLVLVCWLWRSEENNNNSNSEIRDIRDRLLPTPKIMLEACDQNGVDYDIIDRRTIKIGKNRPIRFIGSVSNINRYGPRHMVMNKRKCSTVLDNNQIPVPKFQAYPGIKSNEDIEKIINNLDIPYPLVVKPACGQSGVHIHVGVQNETELRDILKTYIDLHHRKIKCDEVMIEEYVPGDNYRFLYFDDKLLDVVKREIPYVIGDGKSDLITLVRKWKAHRKADELYPMQVDWRYLKKNGIDKKTIIADGIKFTVKQVCGCCVCNYIQVSPDSIHPLTIQQFQKVGKATGLILYGLDVISTDLSQPNTSKINEVNSAPSMRVHYYRDLGYLNRQRDLSVPLEIINRSIKS